jgi:hypothetical protein
MRNSHSNLFSNKYLSVATHFFAGLSLLACQAKITSNVNDVTKMNDPVKIETTGTWASKCNINSMFGYSEITVLDFNDQNVKYDNYHYSDSTCSKLTFEEHKIGEFSIGQQNNDSSYDIDYAFDIGQGVRQLFFDIIKRDGENLYFGESLAPGENYRSKAVVVERPYGKVESGYKPSPNKPNGTKPIDNNPPNVPPVTSPNQPPTVPSTTPTPTPEEEEAFLGEAKLELSENQIEADYNTKDRVYKYFKYTADQQQKFYIGSMMSSDTCPAIPKKKIEWIEVLENNTLGTPVEIKGTSSFTALAKKNYILKFSISQIQNCYASFTFSIEKTNF